MTMTDPTRHPDEPEAPEDPTAAPEGPTAATTGPGPADHEAPQAEGATGADSASERDAPEDLPTEEVDASADDAAPEDEHAARDTAAEAVPSETHAHTPAEADPLEAEPNVSMDEASTGVDEAQPTSDEADEAEEADDADEAEVPPAPDAPVESGEPVEPVEPDESDDARAHDRIDDEPQSVPAEPLLLPRVDPLERPGSMGSEDYRDAVAEPGRGPVEGKAAWRRMLLMGRPRATRANLLGALLAVLLGAGIAAQVQLTNERGLDELSQSDLVRVLDDVSVRSSRLDQQVRELESTRDRLKSGTGTAAEALAQAQKRIDTLAILAGSVGVKGPGIVMTISDPDNQVTGPLILDMIQELRDAGAESIDVGGVRVVASSFVGDANGDILIDGKAISRPIVVKAIGDSNTLSSAMTIPGGIIETVRQKSAEAAVSESENVEITSIHEPSALTYAKPVE
jgi:uncharacterized protein YlxW (UPF0749 family)